MHCLMQHQLPWRGCCCPGVAATGPQLTSIRTSRVQAARCHYKALGVQPTASVDEIKSAFRRLALQLHPDVNPSPSATERFKGIKDAYEVLSDPQQRAAYNRQQAVRAQASYTPSSRSSHGSAHRASTMQYVVYDMEDLDESFEEAAAAGFWGWYQQSGSWQSSWKANRKKRQQQQQQQRQASQQQGQPEQQGQQHKHQATYQQQHRRQQQFSAAQHMVAQLDVVTLHAVRSIFGHDMERLQSLEELVDVLEDLEMLQHQGISFDTTMFGGSQRSSSSSRAQTAANGSTSRTGGRASASSPGMHRTREATGRRSTAAGGAYTRTGTGRSSSSSSSSSARAAGRSTMGAASSSSKGPWAGNIRQRSRGLPRFDELSAEELYELINSSTDARAARAAKAWVQESMATKRLHPTVARSLAFLLAMDYITEDLEQQDPREWVFGELFDPDSARYKGRARAGYAGDYVRYSSDSEGDSDGDDDDSSSSWLDVLMSFFALADSWDDDADDSDSDSNSL